MPRFFVKNNQVNNDKIVIAGEDVNHIKNVLRKQIGENVEICNQNTGKAYKCNITTISNDNIELRILEELLDKENGIKVDIYQGLPKADKMELIIQKSVELGVNAIIPVEMKRCVVKLDAKNESKKIERWQKIAESAAKQSGRNTIPQVKNIHTIKDLINIKDEYDAIIVCYENEKTNSLKKELKSIKEMLKAKSEIKIAVVIGPEGGLEEKDVEELQQNGAKIVTLGNIILRTETVALNILSVIMYDFSEF